MSLQYQQAPVMYYVRNDKNKMVGTVKETPEGWRYSVKRTQRWSEGYESLDRLKADIEADTVVYGEASAA